jgi:hypothetical protein
MSDSAYEVHTEAHGPHWISWVTRDGDKKPERSVILVAPNEKEAEARAHQWAKQTRY